MSMFKKGGIIADVIRCDEPDYLIWKWHPSGSVSGNNRRENEIRWGSSLRVKEGSVAVFVYKQPNGQMQDFIEGPFDRTLSTKNLPILSGILGLAYAGHSPFQAEVFFINIAKVIQSRFAIPYFDVYDPRFQDFGVPIAVRGTFTFRIKDYREFIKIHSLEEFKHEKFDRQIKDAVTKYIKSTVANAPTKNNLSVIQLEQQVSQVSDIVNGDLQNRMGDEFGVIVSSVDVSVIDIDKSSAGYSQLKAVTQDIIYATTVAKTEAEIKSIHDMQKINMENLEGVLRIQRQEGAYAQHKQTQSANLAAYQTEKQAEVGVAGANALGQMAANNAGAVNLGGGGDSVGFNPAAMMTGLAMGGVIANNISGTMQNAMNGMNKPINDMTPPPIPEVVYNVALNGQSTGPYNVSALTQMAQSGQIDEQTLVWKPGMPSWTAIGSIANLKDVLNSIPPMPPV